MDSPVKFPTKNNLESLWKDDAKLVKQINDAIDCAAEGKWEQSEKLLKDAEFDLEDREPYDTSDVYYRGIWKGQINSVRQYINENSQ